MLLNTCDLRQRAEHALKRLGHVVPSLFKTWNKDRTKLIVKSNQFLCYLLLVNICSLKQNDSYLIQIFIVCVFIRLNEMLKK